MTRKIAGVASLATVVATLGLATTAVSGTAHADPSLTDLPAAKGEPQVKGKADNRPDPQSKKQADLRQRAVDDLVGGRAQLVGKGADRGIQLANGTTVDYPATQSAQLLTFLVQFGDDASGAAYPDNTAGPLHNTIATPDASDNTTYYRPDFNRQHYLDMFFNGLPDQNGESFRSIYKEESSGRFDLQGDVSDWVTVPNAASYYQSPDGAGEEDGTSMMNFLKDGADAWFQAQKDAGKTDAQIKDYLKGFDVWDRFDHDHDGDFNEPDGYIDHFQAIHAGEDESAGAPAWAIWAHRSSTNINADVGPAGNHNGGIQIGDTGLWIRDYTTEPENGGLGVFAHEFGHDLGLPDYYDTGGGDNGTGFWTLMSQGSWNSHGTGDIGTTPNHIGAPDKMFLGWYGANDLAVVDGTGDPQNVNLGPSYHATTQGAQAVAVTLPQGSATITVVPPDQGTHYFYSGTGDDRDATVTSPAVTVPAVDPTLTARVSYDLEEDYDYAYFEVSDDGGATWQHVNTSRSTTADPNLANKGFGITNCSGTGTGGGACTASWVDLSADLSAYAGQSVKLRFETVNDPASHGIGLSVDNIKLGGTLVTDVEDGAPTWTLDQWRVMNGSSYTQVYDRYYLAENRQPMGYDKTLVQGPYSFDYSVTAPNKVDHFPYQDGLLVWYVNGLYPDNNTSAHPGGGQAIPVDSNAHYSLWTQGGTPKAYASGNLNAYDATFDVDQADGLHLTNENLGGVHFDVDTHPSVPVFDDTNANAYWDNTYPSRSSWYSTKVAGVGAMIQVLSSDETTGTMVVKAGHAFVAATGGAAAISGTPAVGQTLTAVAPTFFGTGVTTSFQWMIDGKLVWGASSYQVKPEDAGKKIDLVVTGTRSGYLPFKQTVSVTVPKNAGPVATKAVAVNGAPTVGQTLTATPATWPVSGASTFAWSVGGQPAGTGTSYQLKPADTGKTVTVTETRTSTGSADGTSTSTATGAVAPATTSLSVDAPAKVKKGHRAKITVTLAASGVTPTGMVKVSFAGKKLSGQLVNGVVTISLPKVARPGHKKLVVSYVPDTGFTAATKTLMIRVPHRG